MPSSLCWTQFTRYLQLFRSRNTIPLKSVYFFEYSTRNPKGNDPKSSDKASENLPKEKSPVLTPFQEPTTCCMSGCANCVWLDYAENLCKHYQDGGEHAIREINERISDPSVKAYILHEIRMRNK